LYTCGWIDPLGVFRIANVWVRRRYLGGVASD